MNSAMSDSHFESSAWITIEQIHPFPETELIETLSSFSQMRDLVWCQSEPLTTGLWPQLRERLTSLLSLQGMHRISAMQWYT
jgi:2-oxoglutarate dehydrogenase E1 component